MAKDATELQTNHAVRVVEWCCLAVRKNTHKCSLEYVGVMKQIDEKIRFSHLSSSFPYKTIE